MKIVVFGLSISCSWGNGHATLWRGLCAGLARRGHHVVFLERDTPYYAPHRDLHELPGGRLVLYETWEQIRAAAAREVRSAAAAIVTSYCPDALEAAALIHESGTRSVFYDLDTGVTLARIEHGEAVPYLGASGLSDYDLVLSYTGGRALDLLRERLGARRVLPLYGSVDPAVHGPRPPEPELACDISYIATYAADRHDAVNALLVQTARRMPGRRFLIAGPQYPLDFPWLDNIHYIEHVAPARHGAFYSSSRATLNLTRAAMSLYGFCPSGRMFEAAATATAILTDDWPGLETFFAPGTEVLVVRSPDDVVAALELEDAALARIGEAARERVLTEHTADRRAAELEVALATVEPDGGAGLDQDAVSSGLSLPSSEAGSMPTARR